MTRPKFDEREIMSEQTVFLVLRHIYYEDTGVLGVFLSEDAAIAAIRVIHETIVEEDGPRAALLSDDGRDIDLDRVGGEIYIKEMVLGQVAERWWA